MKPVTARALFDDGLSDWRLNACINYGPPDFAHTRGYKQAADALVSLAGTRRITLDYAVYPICFLYRHYLELSLKSLIREFSVYYGYEAHLEYLNKPNHQLHPLWCRWLTVLKAGDHDVAQLLQHTKLVQELHEVDPGGIAFRYHKTLEGKEALVDTNGRLHGDVAVDALARRIQELAACLDNFGIMISELAARDRLST